MALRLVQKAGEEISRKGLPAGLAPLKFVFNGNGHVSQVAQAPKTNLMRRPRHRSAPCGCAGGRRGVGSCECG
jgi:hypothetical protein